MSCLLQTEPNTRPSALNPGRTVKIYRGGGAIWAGKLAEPQPGSDGWAITRPGVGTLGANYSAHYTTWNADNPINLAIGRGLPWINSGPRRGSPGCGCRRRKTTPRKRLQIFSTFCARTARSPGTWTGPGSLRIIPIPTVPTRLLVATTPAARTITADVNRLYVRYQATADNADTGAAATYGVVSASNAASHRGARGDGVLPGPVVGRADRVVRRDGRREGRPRRVRPGDVRGPVHGPAGAVAHDGRLPRGHRG